METPTAHKPPMPQPTNTPGGCGSGLHRICGSGRRRTTNGKTPHLNAARIAGAPRKDEPFSTALPIAEPNLRHAPSRPCMLYTGGGAS